MTRRATALALAAAATVAAQPPLRIGRASLSVAQRGTATVVRLHGARGGRLALPPDEGIYAHSLDAARLIGAVGDRVAIVAIDYASRPSGPMHECGAGTETELRVLTLRPLRQTFHRRIASCWRDIDREPRWDGPTHRLTLVPGDQVDDTVTSFTVAEDGAVRPVSRSGA